MPLADYQLRHQLYGRLGSLWTRQVDSATRDIARAILDVSGGSGEITRVDAVAGSAVGASHALVEESSFRFIDGDCVTVGMLTGDYDHFSTAPGEGYMRAYMGLEPSRSLGPVPTRLADLSYNFIAGVADSGVSPAAGTTWYIVPIPEGLNPVVIQGKRGYLVSGVDFECHEGYIALKESPADVLPSGVVNVPVANQRLAQPNSFSLDAPVDRLGSKFLARYAAQSHSLSSFLSAAAEYAGLYVFPSADVVLSKTAIPGGVAYVSADAGYIPIIYPHAEMVVGQEVPEGYIVSGNITVTTGRQRLDPGITGSVSLDGVLPVSGLSYPSGNLVALMPGNRDSATGTLHLRPDLIGLPATLDTYWAHVEEHERQSGSFLIENLGLSESQLPAYVDFWDTLRGFYGDALVLVTADAHNPTIDTRLRIFLEERNPTSCVLVHILATDAPIGSFRDDRGRYVVSPSGEYSSTNPSAYTVDGDGLTISGGILMSQP